LTVQALLVKDSALREATGSLVLETIMQQWWWWWW